MGLLRPTRTGSVPLLEAMSAQSRKRRAKRRERFDCYERALEAWRSCRDVAFGDVNPL